MERILTKPSFEEVVAVTTINLPDENLKFNAQRIGPMNFAGLRNADYGLGFRMPTMPELIHLVYASLENKEYKTAKNVIETLKDYWLTGNTSIHYFPEGIFIEDNSQLKNGRIVTPNQKDLESKLGNHEEKSVIFSDDRKVRFVPYGFKRESQTTLELANNPGVIAFSGGEENAGKLARASENYRNKPYLWALSNVKSPETRVAGLSSDDFVSGLDVGADGSEYVDNRCSFGVSDSRDSELKIFN